jgi:hypothetical protein
MALAIGRNGSVLSGTAYLYRPAIKQAPAGTVLNAVSQPGWVRSTSAHGR